jgi:hypothetical protein
MVQPVWMPTSWFDEGNDCDRRRLWRRLRRQWQRTASTMLASLMAGSDLAMVTMATGSFVVDPE